MLRLTPLCGYLGCAQVLSHAAALRMVQDAQLPWAVVLEDTSPGQDHNQVRA